MLNDGRDFGWRWNVDADFKLRLPAPFATAFLPAGTLP
jgi:hypothetical protein